MKCYGSVMEMQCFVHAWSILNLKWKVIHYAWIWNQVSSSLFFSGLLRVEDKIEIEPSELVDVDITMYLAITLLWLYDLNILCWSNFKPYVSSAQC